MTGAVVALAWVVAVFVWPGLPGGAYGQFSVLVAVASIVAGLVVLALTAGAERVAGLGVTRSVVDRQNRVQNGSNMPSR